MHAQELPNVQLVTAPLNEGRRCTWSRAFKRTHADFSHLTSCRAICPEADAMDMAVVISIACTGLPMPPAHAILLTLSFSHGTCTTTPHMTLCDFPIVARFAGTVAVADF